VSVDWGAIAGVLAGAALVVAVSGMVVQTVADVSLKRRARVATFGAAMMLGGFAVFGGAFSAIDGGLILGALTLLSVAVLLPALFVPNRLARFATLLAIPASAAPILYRDWRAGDLADGLSRMAVTLGVVVALLATIFAFVRVREKFQKPKPRRDAHA